MIGTGVRASRFPQGVEWPIVGYMAVIHAGALILCPLFPSWPAVAVAAACYLITGLGITIGYHRLLTHAAFDCAPWLERVWTVLALLAGEGPPLFWVMSHRKHHRFSDRPGDPHSPTERFSWAHWLWLFPKHQRAELGREYARWVPRLTRQAFYRRLESSYVWIQLAFGGLLFAVGYAVGSWFLAWSFLGYAYFLRMVLVLHATWLVNSLAHRRGYRTYDTEDESRNNPFVALVALGEGWHNNHHQIQPSANHGHRWWEFDPSFGVILLMAALSQPLRWIGRDSWRPVSGVRVYRHRAGRLDTWFA